MIHPAIKLAMPHLTAGRDQQALAVLRRALDKEPGDYELADRVTELLVKMNLHDQAVFLNERGARAAPRDARFFMLAGDTQMRRKQYASAAEYFQKAYEVDKRDIEPMRARCFALAHMEKYEEAIALARQMHTERPDDIKALALYSGMCEMQGDLAEEVRVLSEAVQKRPDDPRILQSILLPLARVPGLDPRIVFQHHQRMGQVVTHVIPKDTRPHSNVPDPDRPLKIAYCSQDFRNRSAGHFIEPIITNHDTSQFRITLYHNVVAEDSLTARVRKNAEKYVDTMRIDDREMAERIRADRIDILIDLTGHTGMGRIIPFVVKPAPIQYTYMGYPNTTGIPAVDYRIVDWFTDPAGSEHLATETLVRMDGCFLCYSPPPHAGDPAPTPSLSNGHITFGSFNSITKVNTQVLDVWAEILKSVPGSRLFLKAHALGVRAAKDRVLKHLASKGIAGERVDLMGETKETSDHMGMYSKVDIGLDPWPYNGTTTTVEAMYMGVPVVVREGNSHVSRVGVSLLSNVGLADLIAKDDADYVRLAVELAGNQTRRVELRSKLRAMITSSVLCDHAGFTRRLEAHYRQAWREWCVRKQQNPAL